MRDDEFEWHDPKAARNLREHGVSFETAQMVFQDTSFIELEDDRDDYKETRYIVLGRIGIQVFCVVYTPRNGRKRIISARKAEKDEEEEYYGNLI